jgi:hypothetical protein
MPENSASKPYSHRCCRPEPPRFRTPRAFLKALGPRATRTAVLGAGHLAKLEPRQSREIGFYVAIRALSENSPQWCAQVGWKLTCSRFALRALRFPSWCRSLRSLRTAGGRTDGADGAGGVGWLKAARRKGGQQPERWTSAPASRGVRMWTTAHPPPPHSSGTRRWTWAELPGDSTSRATRALPTLVPENPTTPIASQAHVFCSHAHRSPHGCAYGSRA